MQQHRGLHGAADLRPGHLHLPRSLIRTSVRTIADAAVLDELAEVVADAFAIDPALAGRWFERAGVDQLRVGHDDHGDVVGGLIQLPMGQWFGGRPVPLVGFAGVAVRSDRRRLGVASELLRASLSELRTRGVALAGLYASNQSLYRAAGFEHAAGRYTASLHPRDIRVSSVEDGYVERGTEDHEGEVAAAYRDHATTRAGFLDRTPYGWNRILRPALGGSTRHSLLRAADGSLRGWVAHRLERQADGSQRLEVVDVFAREVGGWAHVWSHLADLGAMVSQIALCTAPTDPLYLSLAHPLTLTAAHPYLLRIVDPRAALLARGYARGQFERVVLRVVDPILGDETLTIDVAEGHAEVRLGGDPTAHVHIRGFSGMYSGHLSPHDAQAMGLVEAGPRSLAALQALFAGPAPWMREMF